MSLVSVQKLGKHFGGQDIFEALNFTVSHGARVALVGPNGEGKTTLLRILAGLEQPSAGSVQRAKDLTIGYLEQHPSLISDQTTLWQLALAAFAALRAQETELAALEKRLVETTDEDRHTALLKSYGEAQALFEHAGGYTYEQTIRQILAGVGFSEADYATPLSRLSGGQQSRAQLARLLLEQPDLLLLDEPTNHLDLASVQWLENYLQTWPGAIIVVAHDRYFLDKVANRVWELAFGDLEIFRGNFSQYTVQRGERFERRLKEYQAQQEFIAKEEDFIRRNLAGQRTKEAQGRRKRLERMEKLARPQTHKTLSLTIQPVVRSGDLVLATHQLQVGYPDGESLFRCPEVEIRRGQRVALLGPNGAGKTTFLKTILGQLAPKSGHIRLGAAVEIGYFAQTQASLNLDATILDEILAMENMPIGDARNFLGRFLFSGDDVYKSIRALSGGERSRVALAKLVLTGANFFILDEPTNHLDIQSQEHLEQILGQFGGTILLVSHDRYFVDALATHVWALEPENRSVTVLEGGYTDYLTCQETQKVPGSANGANSAGSKSQSWREREQTKAEKRAQEKKSRQLAELEQQVETTEAKLARLAEQLEAAGFAQDILKLQELGRDYQATEAELENLLTVWTELETG